MSETRHRECLNCGMLHQVRLLPDEPPVEQLCSKCDSPLFAQTDGSTLTVDIAHQRETVAQALDKFARALNRGRHSYARQVRLIVGGGAIRDAVLGELHYQRSTQQIIGFVEEGGNRGALLVRIR